MIREEQFLIVSPELTYVVRQLSDRQTIELDNRLKNDILKNAMRVPEVSADERSVLMQEAFIFCEKFSYFSQTGFKSMQQPLGLSHAVDLALQRAQDHNGKPLPRPSRLDIELALRADEDFMLRTYQQLVRPLYVSSDGTDQKASEADSGEGQGGTSSTPPSQSSMD